MIIVTKKNDEGYGAKFSSRLTFPIKQENLITAYQKKKTSYIKRKIKRISKFLFLKNFHASFYFSFFNRFLPSLTFAFYENLL